MQDDLNTLWHAVSQGDREALRQLYALAAPRLYGIALRILRDRQAAAEVLARVFIERVISPDTASRHPDNPLLHMVSATRSYALDRVRVDAVDGHALDAFERDADAGDPLAREERSPELTQLLASLGRLTEERRRMILYAYYDGWSRGALSIYFDAPVPAVNSWVGRSIAELDSGFDA